MAKHKVHSDPLTEHLARTQNDEKMTRDELLEYVKDASRSGAASDEVLQFLIKNQGQPEPVAKSLLKKAFITPKNDADEREEEVAENSPVPRELELRIREEYERGAGEEELEDKYGVTLVHSVLGINSEDEKINDETDEKKENAPAGDLKGMKDEMQATLSKLVDKWTAGGKTDKAQHSVIDKLGDLLHDEFYWAAKDKKVDEAASIYKKFKVLAGTFKNDGVDGVTLVHSVLGINSEDEKVNDEEDEKKNAKLSEAALEDLVDGINGGMNAAQLISLLVKRHGIPMAEAKKHVSDSLHFYTENDDTDKKENASDATIKDEVTSCLSSGMGENATASYVAGELKVPVAKVKSIVDTVVKSGFYTDKRRRRTDPSAEKNDDTDKKNGIEDSPEEYTEQMLHEGTSRSIIIAHLVDDFGLGETGAGLMVQKVQKKIGTAKNGAKKNADVDTAPYIDRNGYVHGNEWNIYSYHMYSKDGYDIQDTVYTIAKTSSAAFSTFKKAAKNRDWSLMGVAAQKGTEADVHYASSAIDKRVKAFDRAGYETTLGALAKSLGGKQK